MPQTVNVPGIGQLQFPDGMSQADMAAAIQRNFPQIHAPSSRSLVDQIPLAPGAAERMAAESAQRPPAAPDTFAERVLGGIVEPALATGTGMLGGAAGAIAGIGKAAYNKLTTGEGTSDADVNHTVESVANALTYQPRTATGQALTQKMGEAINDSGIIGVPIPELEAMSRAAGSARAASGMLARANAAALDASDAVAAGGKGRFAGRMPIADPVPVAEPVPAVNHDTPTYVRRGMKSPFDTPQVAAPEVLAPTLPPSAEVAPMRSPLDRYATQATPSPFGILNETAIPAATPVTALDAYASHAAADAPIARSAPLNQFDDILRENTHPSSPGSPLDALIAGKEAPASGIVAKLRDTSDIDAILNEFGVNAPEPAVPVLPSDPAAPEAAPVAVAAPEPIAPPAPARMRSPLTPAQDSGLQSAGAAASQHASMAEATGAAPPVLDLIRQAEQVGDINPTAAYRHAVASSLDVPVDLTAGMATGDAILRSEEWNLRGKYPEYGQRHQAINNQIIENFDAIRQQVAPDVSARGIELGQMGVDAYKAFDQQERAHISGLYKQLEDANGGDFPLNGHDFVTAADAALKKANRTRFLPSEVQGILGDLREGGPMTFADFENYRTILAEQARKAERAGDGTAGYAVGLVREALESLPMPEESAAIKPLADAARSAARDRFNRILHDPAYKAVTKDGTPIGEPSPLADKFIETYVAKGKSANLANMRRNLGGDPLNQQIIAAGLIDHLKDVSGIDLRTNEGNVSQARLNSTVKTLDKKLGLVLPDEAAQKVTKLADVANWAQKQDKATIFNNSNTRSSELAETGDKALMHLADAKTLGAASLMRRTFDQMTAAKRVKKSLAPGAGIRNSDFAQKR